MTKKPQRTHPLDRDGDGAPGGSLPGNQTAPMAEDQTPLEAIAEAEPELVDQVINDHGDGPDAGMHDTEIDDADTDASDDTDTFTPEHIEATQPPAIEQADTANAPEAATPEQIAVRVRELQILRDARRLYKNADGYSPAYGAPYIQDATVKAWVEAGLAEDVPSAGHSGGVRITPEGRRQLTELKHGVAA